MICLAKKFIAVTTIVFSAAATISAAPPLPPLHADGTRMVDDRNHPITLRGCNVGNWLILESWMLGWSKTAVDQFDIEQKLAARFGETDASTLMENYRAGFVADRDFEIIHSFGSNLVRLPFNYRLLQSDEPPFDLKPNAFKWLDHAADLAAAHGIYLVLDMHGAPGGQSREHHTGHAGQNKFFSDPVDRQRSVDLWKAIASHFRNRNNIAAYDLINEPWSDYQQDPREILKEFTKQCYDAIRSTGDSHVILFPGAIGHGVMFYGDLTPLHLSQVGFTDHFYPGLFGSPPEVSSHLSHFKNDLPPIEQYLTGQNAPMLVGEFNVVLARAGGANMLRRHFDEYARRGWMATMWSYKLIKSTPGFEADRWMMVTNANALPEIDLEKSPRADIEKYLSDAGTMKLEINEEMRTAMTEPPDQVAPLPPIIATPDP